MSMSSLARRVIRYRAVCPYCEVKFSRLSVLHGGKRHCGACNAVLTATEPANFLGSLVIGTLTAFTILIGFGAGAFLGDSYGLELWSLISALLFAAIGAAAGLSLGWFAWPYATPFHAL